MGGVNPESSPIDPPPVCIKKYSPVQSSIQRDPKCCSEIPQRIQGKNYVQISLNLYSKLRNDNFFFFFVSLLSLLFWIKFCDDLYSMIGDFEALYSISSIESFLDKKRGPDFGNKTSCRF